MNELLTFGLFCVVLLLAYFVALVMVLKTHFNITWWEIVREIAFKRSGGTYIFYVTFIYFWIAMYSVFVEPVARIEYIQMIWLLACSLPLWIPPLAKFLRMRTLWK
jgi:hypothetical protein